MRLLRFRLRTLMVLVAIRGGGAVRRAVAAVVEVEHEIESGATFHAAFIAKWKSEIPVLERQKAESEETLDKFQQTVELLNSMVPTEYIPSSPINKQLESTINRFKTYVYTCNHSIFNVKSLIIYHDALRRKYERAAIRLWLQSPDRPSPNEFLPPCRVNYDSRLTIRRGGPPCDRSVIGSQSPTSW